MNRQPASNRGSNGESECRWSADTNRSVMRPLRSRADSPYAVPNPPCFELMTLCRKDYRSETAEIAATSRCCASQCTTRSQPRVMRWLLGPARLNANAGGGKRWRIAGKVESAFRPNFPAGTILTSAPVKSFAESNREAAQRVWTRSWMMSAPTVSRVSTNGHYFVTITGR